MNGTGYEEYDEMGFDDLSDDNWDDYKDYDDVYDYSEYADDTEWQTLQKPTFVGKLKAVYYRLYNRVYWKLNKIFKWRREMDDIPF